MSSNADWPTADAADVRVPHTSMLPEPPKPVPAAVDLMQRVVHGAHATVDRVAEGLAPKVERLSDRGDAWAQSLRHTVRKDPLTAMAAALAMGALLSRLLRR